MGQLDIQNNLLTETDDSDIQVTKNYRGSYNVYSGGVIKHPDCTADDVIRALTNYLSSYKHKAKKTNERR